MSNEIPKPESPSETDDEAALRTGPGEGDARVSILWRLPDGSLRKLNRAGYWSLGEDGRARLSFAATLGEFQYVFVVRPLKEVAGPGRSIYRREFLRQALIRGTVDRGRPEQEVTPREVEVITGDWKKKKE